VKIALLDVNFLVALFDPAHLNHEEAHEWFGRNRRYGWSTCPITVNGCTRVLSNPAYPSFEATPKDVLARLRQFCGSPQHRFWSDSISLLDAEIFSPELIGGHQKITDAYLLALALRNDGRLATFDRSIPLKAVIGAKPEHLELVGEQNRKEN
jgi:hypothetical protein